MEALEKVTTGDNTVINFVPDASLFDCLKGHLGFGTVVPTGTIANMSFSLLEFGIGFGTGWTMEKKKLISKGYEGVAKLQLFGKKKK
jgi:hypothetical protein